MVDRYQDDLKRAKGINDDLTKTFKERQELQKQGKPTGRFDYRLKSDLDKLKLEIVALDKLIYLYQNNDAKYADISQT